MSRKIEMKCVALIDAGSVEMTTHYARLITEEVRHRFGVDGRPNLLVLTLPGGCEETGSAHAGAGKREARFRGVAKVVSEMGAEAMVLCPSARRLNPEPGNHLPILSIYEPTKAAVIQTGLRRIGLVGARTRDEEEFWRTALLAPPLAEVLLPLARDRDHLVRLIDHEFDHGMATESARADVMRIAHSLRQAGAKALVVVAPAITTLLEEAVPVLPVYDSTELHAIAVVDWMVRRPPPPYHPATADSEAREITE